MGCLMAVLAMTVSWFGVALNFSQRPLRVRSSVESQLST